MASYDKFLQLPLFQGLKKKKLTELIEKIKFCFNTYQPNKTIVEQHEDCRSLIFILEGEVIKETKSESGKFVLQEKLTENAIIEATSLFGLDTTYSASYIAAEKTTVLVIEKSYLLAILLNDDIIKLNFANLLSSKVHLYRSSNWFHFKNNSLLEDFKKFINQHCENTRHQIVLKISMPQLAFLLRDTRLNVSNMLNQLKKEDIIVLKRMTIIISHPQALFNYIEH